MNYESPDWAELVAGIAARLADLDRINRGSLTPEKTQEIRGEIRGLEWVLDWQSRHSPPDIASFDIAQ